MKVVALVSGGKDSCYAMMECVRWGHEIVVLAHLHPPLELAPEDAEIDSFMYQSVGHNVVSLIAESMELPLVTDTITGSAVTQAIDYHAKMDGDEVEDLFRLLENVVELLDDMVESGIEAIIVKVASIGLTPRKHLGKTIATLQPEFLALHEKYQLNVCGEGGEYESLTLDCPLFKKRIVIDSSRVVLHSDDFFAPVAFLVIEECHLEEKEPASPSQLASRLLSTDHPDRFQLNADTVSEDAIAVQPANALATLAPDDRAFLPHHSQFRNIFHLSGVMSARSATLTLKEEMNDVFDHVRAALEKESMTLEDVCFVHLYVRDMHSFAQINDEYCRFFSLRMPPSRSCVEVSALPARVLLDCVGVRGSGKSKLLASRVVRDVLHITSISAWAPNCIGPYSQANILHKSLILLAGQVAFLPQTMEIIGADHAAQARVCYRNAGRVLEALDSNLRHVCSAVVYATELPNRTHLSGLAALCRAQLVANAGLKDNFGSVVDSDESDDEVDKDAERVRLATHAPLLVVQVSRLPRHALVEVELQAFTHRVLKHLSPASFVSTHSDSAWTYECQRSIVQRALCVVMCIAATTAPPTQRLDTREAREVAAGLLHCVERSFALAQLPWNRAVHFRVFYRQSAFESELAIASAFAKSYRQSEEDTVLPAMTFVPTDAIVNDASVALQVTAHDLEKLETELWLRKQI
ncbi:hypothetical protein PybrP1_006127 [[Pythium] brassicae (nom. inval.)]|nr:hypothetical protein PybrP1_006127 [[Pythium] brassicae (nom. inval.)]